MIDASAVLEHLEQLRALAGNGDGAQPVAGTPLWSQARQWLRDQLRDLPVEQYEDAAGNFWVTLPGASERALVLGSHLDAAPSGAWLDGCLGTLASLEVLKALARRHGGRPPCTIRLVDWADPEAAAEQRNIAAYLELHSEPAPMLERSGNPLGVVTGTMGVERWAIAFQPVAPHGLTAGEGRSRALAACAKIALEIRPIASRFPQAVAAVDSMATTDSTAITDSMAATDNTATPAAPGSPAVDARCEATLEMRDPDPGVLLNMLREARSASERFADEEQCTVRWSRISSIEPLKFYPQLVAFCDEAIRELTGTTEFLPSASLHDAAAVARLGIPTAVIFVQSLGGGNQPQDEHAVRLHLQQAAEAFGRAAESAMHWVAGEGAEGNDLWAREARTPHTELG